MPKIKQAAKILAQLEHQLLQAAAEKKWIQVRRIDKKISQFLLYLKQHPALWTALDEPLKQLATAHATIVEQMGQRKTLLQQKMKNNRDNKDGLLAYLQTSGGY